VSHGFFVVVCGTHFATILGRARIARLAYSVLSQVLLLRIAGIGRVVLSGTQALYIAAFMHDLATFISSVVSI
jgi:hypothetical protein